MRRSVTMAREYSRLSQADEEIACKFDTQSRQRHENDARKRLIIACLFCTVFIVCEVTGKGFLTLFESECDILVFRTLLLFFDLSSYNNISSHRSAVPYA